MNRRTLLPALVLVLLTGGCKRSTAPEPLATARGGAATDPSSNMVADTSATVAQASLSQRSIGKVGDSVEGDVYDFKVLAFRRCDGPASSVGVEVEITAKAPLAVSPRDVRLQSGGVIYYASLDPLPADAACTPVLSRIVLQPKGAAKGFVRFDVPPPEPPNFEVVYQPTRWGGAYAASVALPNVAALAK